MTEPVEFPIEDVLDLHTFRPSEVPYLLDDYLTCCLEKGILEIRIIHGKGTGKLRQTVQKRLDRNPLVADYKDAPPEAGGWGATIVHLHPAVE